MRPEREALARYFARRAPFYDRLYAGEVGPLARRWWRPLLDYRERTLAALAPCSGKRFLEIGCGTGHLAVDLASQGASVVAIDLSPEMIERARSRSRERGVERRIAFEAADFGAWPAPTGRQFDAVVALAVLEYCDAPEAWLRRMARLARDLVATFPTPDPLQVAIRRLHHALRGRVPLRFYRREDVSTLLGAAGFSVLRADALGSTLWVHAVGKDTA